jgi:hypothetical protein
MTAPEFTCLTTFLQLLRRVLLWSYAKYVFNIHVLLFNNINLDFNKLGTFHRLLT